MTSLLRRSWRPLGALAAVAGLAFAVRDQAGALRELDWTLPWSSVLPAAALLAVAPLLQAVGWRWALLRGGAAAPLAPTMRVWGRSFLLRYEPSGAVGFAYRVTARERLGASTPQVLVATAYEQVAAVLGGVAVATGAAAAAGLRPPVPGWALTLAALVLLAVVAVAARPALLGRRARAWLATRGVDAELLLPARVLAGLVGLQLAGWAASGLGAALLAHGLGIDVGAGPLVAAFAGSWVLGVLVPLAPGGLGLRDGAVVLALAGAVGASTAAGLALALRLLGTAGELLAGATLELAALVVVRRASRREDHEAARWSALDRFARPPVPAAAEGPPVAGRTVVVVPTYDEVEALPLFVARFAGTGLDLLVVDDDSPDGTGALADALAADRPWMHVLHRASKDGLGEAYRAGFAWALARDYEVVGQMDADLSHPPETLAELGGVLRARDADLVIANRYLPGGGTQGWSRGRRLLSRVGCAASKRVLGLPFDDLSGGFKLWRASALGSLDLDGMLATGYAFQVETTLLAHAAGLRIEEVPFVFSERVAGASKMSLAISLEGIRVTLGLRRRHRGPRLRRHRGLRVG